MIEFYRRRDISEFIILEYLVGDVGHKSDAEPGSIPRPDRAVFATAEEGVDHLIDEVPRFTYRAAVAVFSLLLVSLSHFLPFFLIDLPRSGCSKRVRARPRF